MLRWFVCFVFSSFLLQFFSQIRQSMLRIAVLSRLRTKQCFFKTKYSLKDNKKTLCVLTIAMICSNLTPLWKFQYFRRPIYNPVKHLWCSFYCKNSKPLRIFTKKLHHRCLFWFKIHLCFLKTYFFKVFYIRSLKSVTSLSTLP